MSAPIYLCHRKAKSKGYQAVRDYSTTESGLQFIDLASLHNSSAVTSVAPAAVTPAVVTSAAVTPSTPAAVTPC